MPKAGKILSIHDCRVGDAIAYKHPGGYPLSVTTASSNSSISSTVKQLPLPLPFYVPPLWLNATIVSISEKHRNQEENETTDHSDSILVRIRVKYPSQDEPWEVDVSSYRHQLMNHFWVVQTWMLPRAFCKTQVMLAQKYLQYLDCSVAANTPVRVVTLRQQEAGGDGDDDDAVHDHDHNDVDRLTTREGTILDWKDFDWKHIFDSNKSDADGFTLSIKTDYDSYYWDELPVPVKTAALAFGYTKSYWDDDIDIPADSKDSDELTEAQKEAATVLGYVRQKLVVSEITSTSPGAHVPVQWNDNHQSSSLVPLSQLVFPDTRKYNLPSNVSTTTSSSSAAAATAEMLTLAMTKQADDDEKLESLQRQSLIRALESSGKSIGNAESILGTTELSAFWPDNDEWYDATPIDIVQEETNSSNSNSNSNNKLSLKLLATHFEYQLPGIYCPIMYEDGVRHLIPLNYIFKRGRQPQQQEGDDDQSSTEEASSPTTSLPTEEAIDDLSASLLDISLKTASFGEHFSEVASKIEEASKLIHAAFEKKNKDDQHKQEQGQPGEANTDISSSSTTNTNSTEPSSKIYIEDDWSDLPEHVKNAARSIGYNKKLWDTSDEDIPDKEWKDLTLAEKGALEIIGYKEAEWQKDDSEDDSDDDDSDDDY